MIFTFDHLETHEHLVKWFRGKFKPQKFYEKLAFWQNELEWNPIFFENHDQIRSVTDLGDDKVYWKESAKMLAILLLTLKGTPFIYQGEEIGMTNAEFKKLSEIQDIESLNGYRLLRKWGLPKSLAQKFNEFYHHSPVLKAEPKIKEARLVLIQAVATTLKKGLALLGIEVLEEM